MRMLSLLLFGLLILPLGRPAFAVPKPADAPIGERPELVEFAVELAQAQGWEAPALVAQLAAARNLGRIKPLILPAAPGAIKNWAAYRQRFVEARRIQAGLQFWAAHAAALDQAEARYGVPPEIVVGVIGVETFFGRLTGEFNTLDVLTTLAFDFPREHPRAAQRQAFFRGELAEFLKLAHAEGLDPRTVTGSYAGALGWPQFMPGSWRRLAVDFDEDGRVDLLHSPVDAIGSVAHYLADAGWQRNLPTHFAMRTGALPPPQARLGAADIEPRFSAEALVALGLPLSEAARSHPGLLAVVELQNGPRQAASYRLGTQNFYAITRYNWSAYYAFAVIELGAAIKAKRPRQAAPPAAAPSVRAPH